MEAGKLLVLAVRRYKVMAKVGGEPTNDISVS